MPIATENVVLVAAQFNPSIASPLWLARHGIIDEADATGGIFTPALVNVPSERYDLVIMLDRLQLTIKGGDDNDKLAIIQQKVGGIARGLPETPYIGCGQNFQWLGRDLGDEFARRSAALFLRDDNPLTDRFGHGDSAFGLLCVTETHGTRLTLAIGPAPAGATGQIQNKFQFAFNFAVDLAPGGPIDRIEHFLAAWPEHKRLAADIVAAYGEE